MDFTKLTIEPSAKLGDASYQGYFAVKYNGQPLRNGASLEIFLWNNVLGTGDYWKPLSPRQGRTPLFDFQPDHFTINSQIVSTRAQQKAPNHPFNDDEDEGDVLAGLLKDGENKAVDIKKLPLAYAYLKNQFFSALFQAWFDLKLTSATQNEKKGTTYYSFTFKVDKILKTDTEINTQFPIELNELSAIRSSTDRDDNKVYTACSDKIHPIQSDCLFFKPHDETVSYFFSFPRPRGSSSKFLTLKNHLNQTIYLLMDVIEKSNPKKPDEPKIIFYYYKARTVFNGYSIDPPRGGGGGFGAARSDKPGEDYIWYGEKKLGFALGLDTTKWLGDLSKDPGDGQTTHKTETYYRTNTPKKLIAAKTPVDADIDPTSKISYYKQLSTSESRNTYAACPSTPAIPRIPTINIAFANFKQNGAPQTPKSNPPLPPTQPSDLFWGPTFDSQKYSSQIKPGGVGYFKKKVARADVAFSAAAREDTAKQVYNALREKYKNDSSGFKTRAELTGSNCTKFPATLYTKYILNKGNDATEENAFKKSITLWKTYSNNNKDGNDKAVLPTSQEWCHLYGHALGGKDHYHNFVSGSHYCNTEQLAMEMAVRGPKDLAISITAYRLADSEIAMWMRFKIYYKTHKIFDHIFDGQCESFDYNEYKVLDTTVRRVVAEAIKKYGNDDSYLTAYEKRLETRYLARQKLDPSGESDDADTQPAKKQKTKHPDPQQTTPEQTG